VALQPKHIGLYQLTTYPPKPTDLRSGRWEGGTCQLEALPPDVLAEQLDLAIRRHLDGAVLEEDRELRLRLGVTSRGRCQRRRGSELTPDRYNPPTNDHLLPTSQAVLSHARRFRFARLLRTSVPLANQVQDAFTSFAYGPVLSPTMAYSGSENILRGLRSRLWTSSKLFASST
jgi:hypothetical protein